MGYSDHVLIVNANLVTGQGVLENGAMRIAEGKIAWIGRATETGDAGDAGRANGLEQVIDARGGWLLPGFIDIHVHGGHGCDFMEASETAYDEITHFHGCHGTTTILATTVTASKEAIDRVLIAAEAYRKSEMPGARLIGVHLEGPFISDKYPGAQNPAFIVPPNKQWVEDWAGRHPGLVRILTLAPENEGAMDVIERATELGIVCACGHTNSSYATLLAAADRGLRHAVHTFNAMKPLHHREPGTVGAVLSEDRISAEVIADGHHVHPACIGLLARAKPADRLLLITDAIAASGLGDGEYELGGLAVVVSDGVCRLKFGDSLAGSTLTMIDAFRYVVRNVGVSVEQASKMASGNPAELLGIADATGSLAVGKQADALLLSPELELKRVWALGNPIYTAT
jgi:N-acetylglucosamine-6-phosphate deacetylase